MDVVVILMCLSRIGTLKDGYLSEGAVFTDNRKLKRLNYIYTVYVCLVFYAYMLSALPIL